MDTRIASIHFAPVIGRRAYRGQPYEIPAATLNGDPNILVIRDLIQPEQGPYLTNQKRQVTNHLVLGEHIAACLVGHWTGMITGDVGMGTGKHPGIWVVRDRIPVTEQAQKIVNGENLTYEEKMVVDAGGAQVFRPATPEEKAQMWEEDLEYARAADRKYAEWCWGDGNRIYRAWQLGSKEPVPREMPPIYKLAAKFYGLDAEWLTEAASTNTQACPTCEKLVSKTALICQFCQEPVDIQRWAEWKAKKDNALAAAMAAVAVPDNKRKMPLPPPVQIPVQPGV